MPRVVCRRNSNCATVPSVKVVFDERQLLHVGHRLEALDGLPDYPEIAARAEVLLAAAVDAGHELIVPDRDYGFAPIQAVHGARYVDFLVRAQELIDEHGLAKILDATHYFVTADSPISPHMWTSARASANVAIHGATLIAEARTHAYALCRPPGHHVTANRGAGYGYLNNAAIAAQYLLDHHAERVAILDVDVHHGNGTQEIFYDRADVFTVSLHGDPTAFYPFFFGFADERGDGAGAGFNLNVPLPSGTGDAEYLPALNTALEAVAAFNPDILIVALGLDAHEDDPHHGMALTTEGIGSIGAAIAGLGRPTLLVQEGGYPNPALGLNLVSALAPFAGVSG